MYVCAARMKKPVQRAGAAYKKAAGALSAATLDRAQNAVTYRICGCEDARAERYEDTLKSYETAAVRSSVWQSALPPLYLSSHRRPAGRERLKGARQPLDTSRGKMSGIIFFL